MSEAIVDLEQYFERDIIEFLDAQRVLQDSEEKHTASEMLEALATNNISLAAKLIENAVINYNKISSNNVYKEIHFKKLQDMFRQAKEFTMLHPQQSMLKQYVDMLNESKQLEQGSVEKITALDVKFNELEDARIKAEEDERQFARSLEEKFVASEEILALDVRKKDLDGAVKKYRELKIIFEQYPSKYLDKKQELYNDILSFFMHISKLKRELIDQKKNVFDEKVKLSQSVKNNADKYIRLEEINDTIVHIKEDVRKSDFSAAIQRTIELRELTSRIPDSYKHIRTLLNSKIDIIAQRIEFVRRVKDHN